MLAAIREKLVRNNSVKIEDISNPVWLGWSITIECMIGATRVFIMIVAAKRKRRGRALTYQMLRCVVKKRVAELSSFVWELFAAVFRFAGREVVQAFTIALLCPSTRSPATLRSTHTRFLSTSNPTPTTRFQPTAAAHHGRLVNRIIR